MESRITPGRPGELGALVARSDPALLLTRREDDPLQLHGWPIRVAAIDPLDRLWFFAPRDGNTVREALAHENAYAVWQSDGVQALIHGVLGISNDRERIEALWLDDEDLVFSGGPSDPNACLLCLTPRAVDVWQLSISPCAAAGPRRLAGSTLR